jgi:hypothetical protein
MNRPIVLHYVFSLGATLAFLSGCGGSPVPPGAPGDISQTQSQITHSAQSKELLYVTSTTETVAYVYMFSYPEGKLVGKILKQINGLCPDSSGNVYMTQTYLTTSTIFEYAHGGKKPIATMDDPYSGAGACAVDSSTGNLAVANDESSTIAIYQHARGKPKGYYLWFAPVGVAYDPQGHLYAVGGRGACAVLDGGRFRRVTLSRHVEDPMGVQWDGASIAIGNEGETYTNSSIRRYTITGRKGVEDGYVKFTANADYFYVEGSTVLLSAGGYDDLFFVPYPAGGNPTKTLSINTPGSVTVSVAK